MITAIIGIKEISQRVENKNLRILGHKPLFCWIIDTLLSVKNISEIVINADGENLINQLKSNYGKNLKIISRSDDIKGHEVSMNRIIEKTLDHCKNDVILNTHVTNPFLKKQTIENAIDMYLSKENNIFSVSKHQNRFYSSDLQPLNHDPKILKQTQDLECIYEENSLFYIFSKQEFLKNLNRLSPHSVPFITSKIESIDIDTEEEWTLSTLIAHNSK